MRFVCCWDIGGGIAARASRSCITFVLLACTKDQQHTHTHTVTNRARARAAWPKCQANYRLRELMMIVCRRYWWSRAVVFFVRLRRFWHRADLRIVRAPRLDRRFRLQACRSRDDLFVRRVVSMCARGREESFSPVYCVPPECA